MANEIVDTDRLRRLQALTDAALAHLDSETLPGGAAHPLSANPAA